MDNYQFHENGRILLHWNPDKIIVHYVYSNSQLLHCKVQGNFLYWLTTIFTLNKLEQQKKLWAEIEKIHGKQQEPWTLIGDFNNVLMEKDRISGKLVMEAEYIDLENMMNKTGMFKKSVGDYYTWSNKNNCKGNILKN